MEARDYVIRLLKEYNRMTEEIASLNYELEHFMSVDRDAVIEGMNFSSPSYDHIAAGGVADKTATIALNYPEVVEREREEARCAVTERLAILETNTNRLDYYLSSLDREQAEILRRYYFQRMTWREMQDQMELSPKTLRKTRETGILKLTERYASLMRLSIVSEVDLEQFL